MTQAAITKLKDSSVLLPATWKGASVLLRVTGNTATITKVKPSGAILTEAEKKSLRTLGKNVSKRALGKALSKS